VGVDEPGDAPGWAMTAETPVTAETAAIPAAPLAGRPSAAAGRPLAARLDDAEALTALLVKMPAAAQVEAAAHAGFDLVVVDTEHGPAGAYELEHHLRAADAAGIPALVRVPDATPAGILAALDAGATGVVVPHVLDAAGARAVVDAAHYPPRGRRGFATSTRAGGYGAVGLRDHLRRAAAETVVVVQIEDAEAVPRAGEILGVAGVSAVLVGAADLALSMGLPGGGPSVDEAVDRVLAAARTRCVGAMAVAAEPADAAGLRARGADVVASVATSLIHRAFTAAARATAAAAGPAAAGSASGAGRPDAAHAEDAAERPSPASAHSAHHARSACAAERPPLVLLPGMLGDARLFDAVLPALAAHAAPRVARIDLDDTVAGMAESVLAAAPPRFALAGHSLGAIVALEVVRRAPGRVSRLALLNASARPASAAQLAAWADLRAAATEGSFADLARSFARAVVPAARRDDGPLLAAAEAMAHAVGPAGLLRQLAAQEGRPDGRPGLGDVRVPTLVLSGAEDDVCPPELQRELAAGVPGAHHVVAPGAGHLAPLEDPDATAAALVAWLAA
jgi:2-keto-3-deoxy-L-rhamnonate aldolase RhmA/pimeloyl-ACP methyl ester carboxylesterase